MLNSHLVVRAAKCVGSRRPAYRDDGRGDLNMSGTQANINGFFFRAAQPAFVFLPRGTFNLPLHSELKFTLLLMTHKVNILISYHCTNPFTELHILLAHTHQKVIRGTPIHFYSVYKAPKYLNSALGKRAIAYIPAVEECRWLHRYSSCEHRRWSVDVLRELSICFDESVVSLSASAVTGA